MTSAPCEGGSGPQREASLGLCRDQPGMDTETIEPKGHKNIVSSPSARSLQKTHTQSRGEAGEAGPDSLIGLPKDTIQFL